MRLGLFGGTFNPIHLGHLILAEACREACQLDRVWFVVAGEPPNKPAGLTPVAHRLEMVRIAVAGHAAFEVSEIEANRPGPNYSYQTLEAVHKDRPGDELFFLIGSDSLADLPIWRQPERIIALATVVVVNRPAREIHPAPGSPAHTSEPTPAHPAPQASALPQPAGAFPILHVTIPAIGIASHDLRRRVSEGRSIRYQVPRGVEAYIEAQGLYKPH